MLTPQEALAAVRQAQADRLAADAKLFAAIADARALREVDMADIAAELGITRDGLYKLLNRRPRLR